MHASHRLEYHLTLNSSCVSTSPVLGWILEASSRQSDQLGKSLTQRKLLTLLRAESLGLSLGR